MHKIKRKKLIKMNNNYNIPYIPINLINQNIYEELKKLNYNLEKIQKQLLEKEIEIMRLKTGYQVKGVGAKKEYVTIFDVNKK